MTKQETVISKKRGPAPTGKGKPILVRLHPDQLSEIDTWAAAQDDAPSRPEAIRRLTAWGLKATVMKGKAE